MNDRLHCDACDDPACQGFSPTQRQCLCPDPNHDCTHPTCPRYPQPGHLVGTGRTISDPVGFAAWVYDVPREMVEGARDHLDDDCSGCSMPGGRHWDTCPNRWDGRPTR